jgi:hypothetical protein
VATRILHGAAQGVGWHASIPPVECGPAPREQNGAIFALAIRMNSNARANCRNGTRRRGDAGSGLRWAEREPRKLGAHSHGRMRIIHPPHPRPVKLRLIDQQIVSPLRLAQ